MAMPRNSVWRVDIIRKGYRRGTCQIFVKMCSVCLSIVSPFHA